jgi:hypothetical protein
MDIFVLGKRAAQWLSEQLLGPRRTPAEPVAPRLWRGPGNVDCGRETCRWRCSSDGVGGYAWVLELSCPTSCSCPQPAIACDSDNVDSAYLTQCAATDTTTGCSLYTCTRRCQDDGTGNYAWVVEVDCPTSCDCPIPGASCDATNFGEARELMCGAPGSGCVWLCQGGSYWLTQIGCPSADCCCNPPTVPCDIASTRQYVVLGCNCPTSTTQPRCENYCTWNCGWSEPDGANVWLLTENNCEAAAGCICDPPSPRTCSIPGEGTMTPCYRHDSTSSTTSTTSSADQCTQYTCKWMCFNEDGQFYWQRIESCPQECYCNNGYAPPSEDCVCATVGEVRIFACSGDTTTTSSTTTTETTTTSSTTTTETTTTSSTTSTTTTSIVCIEGCYYTCVDGVYIRYLFGCEPGCSCPEVVIPGVACADGDEIGLECS